MSRFDQPEDVTHADDRPDDEDIYREGGIMTIEEAASFVNTSVPFLVKHRDGWRTIAIDRGAQLDRIAAILRRFHGAEISASSVQPILDLCREMNPDLTDPRRI